VENWPESDEAIESQTYVAKLYISASDDANAQAAVEKLATGFTKEGKVVEAIEEVAESWSKSGRYEKAGQLYKRIVATWPDNERAKWAQAGVAMSHMWSTDYDAADAAVKELIDLFSEDADLAAVVHKIVENYRHTGEHDRAGELYQYFVDKQAARADALLEFQVGVVLSKMDQEDEAETYTAIEKLLADFNDHPNLAKGLFQIGEKYYTKGRRYGNRGIGDKSKQCLAGALAVWETIAQELPESNRTTDAYYWAARVYEIRGEYGQAKEYYETVVARWPDWRKAGDAQYKIALCCHKSRVHGAGRKTIENPVEKTREAVEKLIRDYPGSPTVKAGMNLCGGPKYFESANSEGESK